MITATEMTIAARMHGMEYGQFSFALECGTATMPPMEEIRQRIVKPKRGRAGGKANTPVCQYDKRGEFVRSFENALQAAAAFGRHHASSIYAACEGKTRSACGYQWRYIDSPPPGVYEKIITHPMRKEVQWREKACRQCGKMFKGRKADRFCSEACANEYEHRLDKVCPNCGKTFTAIRSDQMYCTNQCARSAVNKRAYQKRKAEKTVSKKCIYCGQTFETTRQDKLYCSDRCREIVKYKRLKALKAAGK